MLSLALLRLAVSTGSIWSHINRAIAGRFLRSWIYQAAEDIELVPSGLISPVADTWFKDRATAH